ncbi:MAG: VWA domain-containing protein [Bryobacteraceae bacterium]|jgi:VWFA-related protein
MMLAPALAAGLWAQAGAPPQLVYLYPVALDPNGQPVDDLSAGDFKVVDQGRSQTVVLFRRPAPRAAEPVGPHEYTNRPGGRMPRSVAILLDLMNEARPNWLDVLHKLAKSVPLIGPEEPVYFYVLNLDGDLVPIHAIGSPGGDDWRATLGTDLDKVMNANLARPAGVDREEGTKRAYHQLELLSNQLAGLPGRRDIIWITNGVPSITNSLPCSGDWVGCGLYVAHTAVTLEHDGVAVNPDFQSGVPQPTTSYDLEQMALLTGGRCFYLEDIRTVLQAVAENAAHTYAIAYAPAAGNWDNKFHKIRITCERKGVKLQARGRYYALPDSRSAEARQKDALMSAYEKPSDAADIGLRIETSPTGTAVHVVIHVEASDLLLREEHGKFVGALTLLLSDRGSAEQAGAGLRLRPPGDPSVSSVNLELNGEQHDKAMKDGLSLALDHPLATGVARMRVVILDQNTNQAGSLTFPVR